MPGKILPDKKIEMLERAGLGPAAIARKLAVEDGIFVTAAAITMHSRRRGREKLRTRHSELLPWVIKPEHRSLHAAKMLRAESRRRRGEELTPAEAQRLGSWMEKLTSGGWVVDYDPAEGFSYVPARPGDDLIRRPKN